MKKNYQDQKGMSLYFVLLMIGMIFVVVLGLTTFSVLQIKIIKGMGDSVIAFYGADAGIEEALYKVSQGEDIITSCPKNSPCFGSLDNGVNYNIIALLPGEGDCPSEAFNHCIQSVGEFKDVRRAIRITR
jgi:Tfp pilus assembly protein PilX